jgi:hypothetical protein
MVFLTLKTLNKPNLLDVETSELQVSDLLSFSLEPLKDFSEPLCCVLVRNFYLVHWRFNHFLVKGVIVEGPTHLTEFPLHRTSAVFYTSVDSTSEMGCGLFLLCNSLVGTATATRVSDVGGARRQSCVTTFTRGRNLMVLGIWKRLNGRFISEPSLRIPNFIRSRLNPLIKPSIF